MVNEAEVAAKLTREAVKVVEPVYVSDAEEENDEKLVDVTESEDVEDTTASKKVSPVSEDLKEK